jgi:hypothetical protein
MLETAGEEMRQPQKREIKKHLVAVRAIAISRGMGRCFMMSWKSLAGKFALSQERIHLSFLLKIIFMVMPE